jgi:hypothetical protein
MPGGGAGTADATRAESASGVGGDTVPNLDALRRSRAGSDAAASAGVSGDTVPNLDALRRSRAAGEARPGAPGEDTAPETLHRPRAPRDESPWDAWSGGSGDDAPGAAALRRPSGGPGAPSTGASTGAEPGATPGDAPDADGPDAAPWPLGDGTGDTGGAAGQDRPGAGYRATPGARHRNEPDDSRPREVLREPETVWRGDVPADPAEPERRFSPTYGPSHAPTYGPLFPPTPPFGTHLPGEHGPKVRYGAQPYVPRRRMSRTTKVLITVAVVVAVLLAVRPVMGLVDDITGSRQPAAPAPAAAAPVSDTDYRRLTPAEWADIARDPDAHAGLAIVLYGRLTSPPDADERTVRAVVAGSRRTDPAGYRTRALLRGPGWTGYEKGDEVRIQGVVLGAGADQVLRLDVTHIG